jgi:hypothetical protein
VRSLTTLTTSRRTRCLSDDRYAARRGGVTVPVSGGASKHPAAAATRAVGLLEGPAARQRRRCRRDSRSLAGDIYGY